MFDRWLDRHCPTEAPAGGSDRPVQSVPETGRTGPAGTGQTNLSNHASGEVMIIRLGLTNSGPLR
ncbi:hypothetical protein PCASD_09566 [Puccinia coronata f. sp. avenae]|uniref:Uncharacterized protein n=1 Tax=Puccinia coronata f. sp. avenae TaxID=200324 RepID=A0A2N5V2B2_9BASI|nr:hypothetical protein PCASD_09566 [Puccinia coronata f. sp. avenae]